jgi:hypothetical protein
MKELVKPVLNDEEDVVVQALCESHTGNCSGGNSSTEEDDEIIF